MTRQITVTFEENEFESKFPEISKSDLSDSDKVRQALGLEPRKRPAGRKIINNSDLAKYNREKQKEYRAKKRKENLA